MGGITDDLGDDCKIIKGIWIAPKLYMLEYIKKNDDKIHYHFRGKGLNTNTLSKEIYETMDEGGSIENVREFQMKKINVKRNNQQKHIPHFSILHQTNCKKIVNLNKWKGRNFINDNDSIPYV